jgi:aspartokinase/homoserine dehydrogenase 1
VNFLYETNVGAGLPIIKTLQDLIHSGDSIVKIEAILSGTISYIFNQYVGNATFAEVVQEAQDKGFTEPNPVDDLSGKDFCA